MKVLSLNKAKTEEFLNRFLNDNQNTDSNPFFDGIHIKNEEGSSHVKLQLEIKDVQKIKEICNGSDILIYNFYCCVLSVLLHKYEETSFFISPLSQFDEYAESSNQLFVLQHQLDKSENFKSLFSTSKSSLLESIENSFELDIFDDSFLNFEDFKNKISFGITIDGINNDILDIVKTLFVFDFKSTTPSLEIRCKGEIIDADLLYIFGENFNKLLNETLENLYEPISNIEFRGNKELHVLSQINLPETNFLLDKNVIELLTEQCENQGDKIAISSNAQTITYKELNQQTNRLARYIQDQFAAGKDDLFGIMLSRSINMVSGILSVWKAGSAYVPVATNLGDDALQHIIENSNLKAIITDDQNVIDQLKGLSIGIAVIDLNGINELLKGLSNAPLDVTIGAEDLSYVIYTSGSTGRPKGAMIEHYGMLNHIMSKITEMGIDKNSIVAQNAPHTFDISVWQFFAPLVAGGTSIIYDEDTILEINEFVTRIAKDKVTLLELVPSYLLEMLNYIESEEEKIELALNILILNAETLTKGMVKRWLEAYSNIPIVNTYGATEVSDDMSHFIMHDVPKSYSVPVLKQTIQNFEIHILDENKQRVPVGVKGEIYLASPCVGRGYFNDEKRTKEAFLKGPIEGITNQERIYKTGDLGRFMPNGTMEFIGRNDNQVKILGHRIELDAIENIAADIKGVKSVKAIAHTDKQIIVLYYVSDLELDKVLMEEELLKKLPKYMIPSAFIHMSSFPLTKNGKIDKNRLPSVQLENLATKEYVAPQNETEEKLAVVWQEVLKIDRIGVTDNFFDLGGHSLLAVRAINRIKKELGLNTSVKTFFENPTIAALSKQLKAKEYIPIEKSPVLNSYPLTASQYRFWVQSQVGDASLAYNLSMPLQFKGDLDVSKLEESFLFLINRHEVLRTSFKLNETGEVRQFITSMDDLDFGLNYVDLSLRNEKEKAVAAFLSKENSIAFNLEQAPLLRVSLIKSGDQEYTFFMAMHHIIGDGWSSVVLFREMVTIYNSLIQSKEVNLPELRIQYKDYAEWLNQEAQQEHYKTSETYWLNQFSGSLPIIELPGFKKRPLVKTYNGAYLSYQFPEGFTEKLKAFSKKQDVTLFMTLMAGINALLNRYTGQQDIVIGSPIAGREHSDLENQIGLYLNTLALRTQMDKDFNFLDLLRHEKEIILGGYEHQGYPFDELVDKLEIKRDSSRSALFDIMVVLQSQSKLNNFENDKLLGLEINEQEVIHKTAQFDLIFAFMETDGLMLGIEYNTDIYEASFIEKMFTHFEQLLSVMMEQPEAMIQQVDYLSVEEKNHLLVDFNDTIVDYPNDKTIIDLFEEQVEKTPNNIAVAFNETALTYKELNEQANQLGHYLREQYDIQPDDLLGIKLERSEQLIISILAVLKSGGAYVPIDPGYPESRQDYIEKDSNCKVIIDDYELNTFRSGKNKYSTINLDKKVKPNNLAYVIYTSGTTGNPKGALLEHKNVVRLFFTDKPLFDFNDKDVWTMFHSYSFDFSVWEMYGALLFGGKLIVIPKTLAQNTLEFLELVCNESVTVLNQTPSAFYNFIECDRFSQKRDFKLRYIIFGGEALNPFMLSDWFNRYSEPKLVNMYGITETTVHVTYKEIGREEINLEQSNIGRPIPTLSCLIFDESKNIVPIGVIGELHIGGSGLARGYLNRPELTSEKFIQNPFKLEERLYKTGDLGRWLPDGNIEYMGRIDNQVKIRGHRIELGEIEVVLLRYSNEIRQVVVDISEINGDKVLVGYYVSDNEIDKLLLRKYLQQHLPEYMIPDFFIALDTIPLTSNGKIDKKILPSITNEDFIKTEYVAPRTAQEKVLAAVWSEVLKHEKIGIKDSFYNLGGDSIKSILIVSRLKQRGCLLKVDQILRYPILEDLALLIVESTVVVDQSEVKGTSALTPIQHYFFDSATIPNKNHYNQAIVLKSKEELDRAVLTNCIGSLVSHHDALRMVYKEEPQGWTQYNAGASEIHYKIDFHDLRGESDELASLKHISDELQSGFDISSGVLFHVGHFRLSDGDRLVLIIHHLVIDGVSWRILLEDLSSLYLSYQSGTPVSLPSKTDSFKRWASLQNDFAKSTAMQLERPYWDAVSKAGVSQLPSDYAVSDAVSNLDKRNGFVLDASFTEKLQTQVHHVYKTEINDLLLTGLGLAIQEVFGVSRSTVKMEGHGREEIIEGVDIGRTVGWFTSVYPFILDVSSNLAVVSVKESLRKIPNKGIGYGILNYLDTPFESSLVPSIQFNYLGDFGSNAGGSQDEVVFEFASENIGASVDANNAKSTILLDVSGMMVSGGLSMSIGYSGEKYSEATIEKLTRAYENQLKGLITTLSEIKQSQLTPSDLTYNNLPFEELQQINRDNNVEDIYELSPLQQGFYYHWLADHSSPMYFQQMAYAVNAEELSIENSKQAFSNLISRYPILRTSFTNNFGDQPLQIVHKEVESNFSYEKMEKADGETVEEYIERVKLEDKAKGFDFEQPSLMRLKIIEIEKNRYVFIWSYHHILMDGWCMSILLNDFGNILGAISANQEVKLPLPLKYSEYIKWLSKINNEESLAYWKNYLNGLETVIDLPFKQKKESTTNFEIKHLKVEVGGDLYQNVMSYCQEIGVTLNVFVQGVWGYLLSRYNNTQDVVFGAVVSGRPGDLPGVETMVGLFINAIPVRLKYSNEDTPKSLLKQIQTEAIASASHHYVNLSEVQSQSSLGGELIKSLLTFENYFVQEIDENAEENTGNQSLYVEDVTVFEQTNYDFNIIAIPSSEALKIDFGYNSEVFDTTLVENLSSNFLKVMTEFSKADTCKLNTIDYLSDKEKEKVLLNFNDTIFEYQEDKTVIDLFEEQVEKTPNSIALCFNNIEFTYKELNEKANQFAHYLLESHKIQANDIIGIKLRRSEKLIVSILGVLKSGGAYVPIDPDYPENRIEYIEKDSRCKIVLDDSYLELFPEIYEQYSKENVEVKDLCNNLSYVIYTSGSTGNPKGVAIGHKSLLNFLISIEQKPKIGQNDYLFSVTTQSFDISILEFFTPLITGALLYIASEELLANPLAIVTALENLKPTILQATPSFYEMLYNAGWKGNKEMKILCGGDLLSETLSQKLLETNAELWNMYGPTETTIWSSCKKITKANESSNVGKPINNTKFYILDQSMQALPIGSAGAIFIGGKGLAKGYYGNQELTDEKFIQSPFDQNQKIYNTGDLGRWNEKGEIEFLGRNDNQVKIRGHRIELGEIELSLQNFSTDIRQVVVDAKKVNDDKVLIAYYVAESEIDKSDLRQYLVQQLPEYMVPAFFISLPKIPLTFNGKTDRKALPSVSGKDVIKKEYVAPKNETEEKLVVIWQDILKVDKIGITDNFLELGGHSLLIVKVINKIKKELMADVSVKTFFENPTVASLSKQLKEGQYIPIERVALQDSYPLTAAQHRFWVVSQIGDTSLAYNMPVVLQLKGELDILKFEESFRYLINRHEVLRTSFKLDEEGQLRQFITATDDLDFSLAYTDLSSSTEIETTVASYLSKENATAFNLEKAPLLRASLLKSGDQEYVFSMIMHHIIGDGWSSELLVKEMVIIYNSLIESKEINLPELKIQYKDYAGWLSEESQQQQYKNSEAYWINQFSGSLPVIELPGSKKRPLVKTYNGDYLNYQFPKAFLEKLTAFSKKHDVTLFMTLMAGINTLLSRYTGQQDIIIGSPIAGREHPDLENQIGLYLNTLALRTQMDKDFNFLDLLSHEKEMILGAYEHQAHPFDELVDKLELNRDNSRSALFDIMVVLQSQSKENNIDSDKLLGLDVYEFEANIKTAQFDLVFTFIEDERLKLGISYNTDIYTVSFVEKIFTHFEHLLSGMIDQPESKIQQVDYLSVEEKQRLLVDFNNTSVAFPRDKTMVDLFIDQVQKTPDNIAVFFEGKAITYRELDILSNSLAQTLRHKYNVQRNDFIGVHLTRSESSVISILGILKAGGVYVPIDSELPSNRKRYIVEDAGLKLLVTETVFRNDLDFYKGNVFLIDVELASNFEISSYEKLELFPNDLAYIIYTSGSTGNPKGVMIEHAGIMNSIVSQVNIFSQHGCSKWLQFSSYSFDASIYEIFISLLGGYSLYILNDETRKDAKLFEKYVVENNVDISVLPPAFLKTLDVAYLKGFKVLITAGESPVYDKVSAFLQFGTYYNAYGPTEVSILGSIFKIEKGSELTSEAISIGSPISNTEIYILDEYNNLLPEGAIGEIHIGGSGLARGYLNRPELTEEKFILNPYKEGGVIYKTGDLGRWLADGNLEYIGRIDEQVKMRGHRIELEEIEKHLSLQDRVKHSVVVVKESEEDRYLVAYYVSDEELNKKELQAGLSRILPEYMIPNYYVQLDTIPMTINGKVDKKLLPNVQENDLIKEEYIAPRTSEEKDLAAVWSEVLKHKNIGIKDSFYNLGGDSIKSILLISRLKQQGYSIKVEDVLRNPVLEDLAKIVEINTTGNELKITNAEDALTPIQNKNHYNQSVVSEYSTSKRINAEWEYGDLMQLSPNQMRFYKSENACVLIRETMHSFNKDTFEKDFRGFLIGFPALSLRYETIEDKIYQRYIHPNDVALEVLIEEVSLLDEKQVQNRTNEFLEKPFELVNGALIRCLVLQEGASGSSATITLKIHHSLLDQYSVNRIYEELCNYFQGESKENNYYHPFDFIVKKGEFLLTEEGQKERDYWTAILQETSLYKNEINPNKETVNVIQETVISNDRLNSIRKAAKKNNIPVSAFFIGFYEMILNTANLDNKVLYSFLINGREQEVEGMDINKILGVTDNSLPISYKKEESNLDFESILEIYVDYLRNRTYQRVPYEIIREDTLKATGYDIDENMSGYLNLFIKEGSVSSKDTGSEKVAVYEEKPMLFYGINLVCELYQDGVYLKLICPKDIYEIKRDQISLNGFIENLLEGIMINENSEINTF